MKDLKVQLSERNNNEESKEKEGSSDQRSAQMVKQAIKDDQGLSAVAKDIHVVIKEGDVVLEGKVKTEQQLNLATNTAAAMVVDDKVKNHLEVTHNK